MTCRYVAVNALQQGAVPKILITGGKGHSTMHLYNSVRNHPTWHSISTTVGRYEAEVLRDIFKALGVSDEQLLPLEVESLHCGGNAECSIQLLDSLGQQPESILLIQVSSYWVIPYRCQVPPNHSCQLASSQICCKLEPSIACNVTSLLLTTKSTPGQQRLAVQMVTGSGFRCVSCTRVQFQVLWNIGRRTLVHHSQTH